MPSLKNPFFKSSATRALCRHVSSDFNKVFSSLSYKITPSFKACLATVNEGASSSQIAPEDPPVTSAATTGQDPSCARTSNDRAVNVPASPPGTSVPVMPTVIQQVVQQSRVDVTQCRTSSIQSEPAPTVPFFTTTDPGTSSRKKVIDLDTASMEESEE